MMLCFAFMPAVSAQSRIDLQVESVKIQPDRPQAGRPLIVIGMIRNNGSEPVRDFYTALTLMQKGKKIKTLLDIPVLSELPRAASGLSVPVQVGHLPEGQYEAIMTVDPRNHIEETDEANNVQSVFFQVYA